MGRPIPWRRNACAASCRTIAVCTCCVSRSSSTCGSFRTNAWASCNCHWRSRGSAMTGDCVVAFLKPGAAPPGSSLASPRSSHYFFHAPLRTRQRFCRSRFCAAQRGQLKLGGKRPIAVGQRGIGRSETHLVGPQDSAPPAGSLLSLDQFHHLVRQSAWTDGIFDLLATPRPGSPSPRWAGRARAPRQSCARPARGTPGAETSAPRPACRVRPTHRPSTRSASRGSGHAHGQVVVAPHEGEHLLPGREHGQDLVEMPHVVLAGGARCFVGMQAQQHFHAQQLQLEILSFLGGRWRSGPVRTDRGTSAARPGLRRRPAP